MVNDVFISYTQPNRIEAFTIHDMLQSNGLVSWIAPSTINGLNTGERYQGQIVEAIKASRVFLLVYSDYCNRSNEIIKEVLNRREKHRTLIVRLDNSEFSNDLSYELRGLQDINASRNNLREVLNRILMDVMRMIGQDEPSKIGSTDQLLFNNGLKHFESRKYEQAVRAFKQHLEITPDDKETRFYLSMSIIGGENTTGLHGRLVDELEDILLPALDDSSPGYIELLLSIIKQGYYSGNGFTVPRPKINDLLNGLVLNRLDERKIFILVNHLFEPENVIWNIVKNHYKEKNKTT